MGKGRFLVSEFDYYDVSDILTGRQQENMDKIGQLSRDLLESADFHVEIAPTERAIWKDGKRIVLAYANEIIRIIRRRDPENIPAQEIDEDLGLQEKRAELRTLLTAKIPIDQKINMRAAIYEEIQRLNEDVMVSGNWKQFDEPVTFSEEQEDDWRVSNVAETQRKSNNDSEFRTSGEKWDLIFDKTSMNPDEWYSADWYPTREWKNNRFGRKVSEIIRDYRTKTINGSQVYNLTQNLSTLQKRRVWEMFRIEKFLKAKKVSQEINPSLECVEVCEF
jgi:hypothetical protein